MNLKLVPNTQERVPGARCYRHTILRNAQARHAIIVASENSSSLGLHGIPDVAIEVVVAGQQQSTALAERYTRDTADNIVVAVHRQFLIRPNVEESASSVVRARRESVSIREERNSVYVALVTREGLLARSRANVPEFCTRVTRAGYECVRVWCQREGHYVARVSNEGGTLLTTFYVPQGASHVPRTSDNLVVVIESTAGQVPSVTREFSADSYISFSSFKTIDGANVIQPTASHVTT